MFAVVWEYRVEPQHRPAFAALYGGRGAWVALFKGSTGFERTVLTVDPEEPGSYTTVDLWQSYGDYQRFRVERAAEYAVLDAQGDALTAAETFRGAWNLERIE
jgi:heme-degrading monooxygenase HmoA